MKSIFTTLLLIVSFNVGAGSINDLLNKDRERKLQQLQTQELQQKEQQRRQSLYETNPKILPYDQSEQNSQYSNGYKRY